MASSKSSFFQASILLVLLLLFIAFAPSFARLSVKLTDGEINDICSKTKNPSFCLSLLKSTPGVSSADLPGLAKITIGLGRSNATNTQNVIKSLIPKATEPRLKESYTSCSEHYDGALGDFDDGEQALKAGDPTGLNAYISAALDEGGDCEDELQGLAADPSVVKGSQDLQSICSIILVVSNLLFPGFEFLLIAPSFARLSLSILNFTEYPCNICNISILKMIFSFRINNIEMPSLGKEDIGCTLPDLSSSALQLPHGGRTNSPFKTQ